MTQEQFEDALGMIDDDLIESVDKLRQQRDCVSTNKTFHTFRSKVIRREIFKWGGLAAGFCMFIGIGFLWMLGGSKTSADMACEADFSYNQQENAEAILEDQENFYSDSKFSQPTEDFQEILSSDISSPPKLYILTQEGESIPAMTGTHSWKWTDENGLTNFKEADSYHPLQSQKYLDPIQTAGSLIQLQFDTSIYGEPDHISAQCWNDAYWDQIDVKGYPLDVTNGQISLKEGGTIYQVIATWENGTAYYKFYIFCTPDPS